MTLEERNEILKNGIDWCSNPKRDCNHCPINQMDHSVPICRDMFYLICSADKVVLNKENEIGEYSK